jgi:hypothetical protein
MPENLPNEDELHKQNVISLLGEYDKRLHKNTIEKTYQDMRSRYEDAPIRIYIPLLAMRDARELLSNLAIL